MAHEVVMPQMGESIAEGTLTTWLKKVGDTVERDEPLFEISTDKVDAEIPSPAAGVLLEIRVEPGSTVPIDTIVAVIGEAGEADAAPAPAPAPKAAAKAAPPAKAPAAAPVAPAAAKAAPPARPAAPPARPAAPPARPAAPQGAAQSGDGDDGDDGRRTRSSPLVRKIAAEHNVDIAQLSGSGLGGRVTKDDILQHIEGGGSGGSGAGAPPPSAPSPGAARPAPTAPAPAPRSPSGLPLPSFTDVPEAYRARVLEGDKVEDLSSMRVKIAEHMVLSKKISPHVGTVWEMDFSHVAALRQKHKKAWEERHGVNLTFTAFILKAAVDAIKAFPVINASVDGNKVILHRHVNLGVAVALDWGLIVPVVHRADELNLLGLARRVADLAARARTKKLKPDEVQSGTFTVSNPGIYGPMFGIPVINQPQVAMMGVGTVEKRPVVINDMIAIRTRAYLSLSFDHRLIDGATADQYMGRVKKNIEEFDGTEL